MGPQYSDFDRFAMTKALALAERGLTTTDPNPRVGCVIAKDGRVIGEGWHERAGGPHAEIAALRSVNESTTGATAYVTLEPCSHQGRTPPCVDSLIAGRFARVVVATQDPNPLVNGTGVQALRRAGIVVDSGLMEAEAIELNAGFIKRMKRARPLVRVKLAMSLDGRTALANGVSKWITGEAARKDVHYWRARSSAVMTGIGTVLTDDPRLDVRLRDVDRQPLRIVMDSQLRTPPTAKLLTVPGNVLIFATAGEGINERAEALVARGAQVELVPEKAQLPGSPDSSGIHAPVLGSPDSRLDVDAVLSRLAELEVNDVLVESGPTLASNLLRRSLVDELLLYIAPTLLGPTARALVDMPELQDLSSSPRFAIFDVQQFEPDLRLRLRRTRS